jgi:hypothetical protein
MRNVLSGLVVGFMLSALRAPLGIDLAQIQAVGAGTAYGYRALALALIAAAWWLKRDGRVSIGFLASAALGFALHSLVLAGTSSPSSSAGLWIVALLGFAALVWLGRGDMSNEATTSASPGFVQMIGLCAAGAGAALALESIARHVRLFGGGLAQDDSVTAVVLLACMLLGAAAGGWIAASERLRSLALPVGLAAAATGCFLSLHTIDRIGSAQGLARYLQRFGLDTSSQATLAYDALIAGSCFVLPGFLMGATLRGTRSKLEIFSALLGAALGLYFVPRLMTSPDNVKAGDLEVFSAELVSTGCLTAVAGAALALLATSSRGAVARWSAIAVATSLCTVPLKVSLIPKLVVSPWMIVPPKQLSVFDTPEGLITVEPSKGELFMATLDRRALTPPTEHAFADAERIKLAVAMVPAERRSELRHRSTDAASGPLPPASTGDSLRVLLIGQSSPVRAQAFKDMGIDRIDRAVPWHRSMKRIDALLFEDQPEPLGDRLSPAEASRKIAAGDYDLVVVEPVPGDAPVTCNLAVPEKTTLVAWFSAEQWIAQRDLGAEVLFASEGIDDPCVGVVVHGSRSPLAGAEPPLLVPAGDPIRAPIPLTRLAMLDTERFEERDNWCRTSLLARLADASHGGPHEELLRGFAILYAAQTRTSGFETSEEATVLPPEALDRFESVALAAPPTAYVRSLWESVARLLLRKRDVAAMYKYLEPLARKYAPWITLDQVLAQADLEALEPEAAARRLSALIAARAEAKMDSQSLEGDGPSAADLAAARRKDIELWYWLGEAQRRAGDHASASQSWRRTLALEPESRGMKRQLAIELVRAADPEGQKMIDEILAQNPSDTALEVFRGPGPYPDSDPEPPRTNRPRGDGK